MCQQKLYKHFDCFIIVFGLGIHPHLPIRYFKIVDSCTIDGNAIKSLNESKPIIYNLA